jgi:phosphoribosylformylglycinamidine cyclo-ligase
LIRKLGDVPNEEMYRVFNMGIGMVAIVDRENGSSFQKAIPEPTWIIGELADGERKVFLD